MWVIVVSVLGEKFIREEKNSLALGYRTLLSLHAGITISKYLSWYLCQNITANHAITYTNSAMALPSVR